VIQRIFYEEILSYWKKREIISSNLKVMILVAVFKQFLTGALDAIVSFLREEEDYPERGGRGFNSFTA